MPFDIETSVGFLLNKAYQRLYARFRDLLAPYNLTPQQFALLAFLWKEDRLPQSVLAEKTDIDRTTLSGLVDRLQKQGLVCRQPHPQDRRVWLVCLTKDGRASENELVPLALQVRRRFSADLEPGEYEQLCHLLGKLRSTTDD